MPTITAYIHAYVPDHNAGAETTMHDLLKYLVSEGWTANVVLKPEQHNLYNGTPEHKEYVIDGVHVDVNASNRILTDRIANADVTISHLECSERTHLMSEVWHKPTVHLVHNTHKLTKRWMAHADGMIVNTEWIAKEKDFFPAKPKVVLHPPVNPDEYATKHGKKITLVNLWEDKGAKVFYALAKRMPDHEFLAVEGGYGVQVIEDLPNVTWMEHTSDMKKVYGETKVLLMPSKYESFGRVGVEAMASGIPVVAEPTPGLLESLGDAGIFADRNDIDAWEKSVRDALKPAKYGKLSKLALARSSELAKQREDQLITTKMFLLELIRIGK